MDEGVRPMASEHKRIVDRLEALERRYEEDNKLGRIHREHHKVLHKWLEERQKALVESVSHLDKVSARNAVVEERLGWHVDRMNRLEGRVQTAEALLRDAGRKFDALEARLASKPDEFGGVTSTGAPRYVVVPKTQWAITRENGYIFCAEYGFAVRSWAAGGRATFFRSEMEASLVRGALFPRGTHADIEEVEVIERDGRLIEARYA